MSIATLVLSQLIALLLGAALVGLLLPHGRGAVAAIAGYGYVLGSIAITLILRVLSSIGIRWSFWLPAVCALLLAALAAMAIRRWRALPSPDVAVSEASLARAANWILWALVIGHVALALNEALLRPLFPWDAAAQWATKARVWFEYRRMVPFVDDMHWIDATGNVFTDAHPTYPGTVPLLQVWAALGWGSFDDARANVAWPLFLAALAVGAYGQLRRLGFVPIAATIAVYAMTSLPFVDVHAALAGYADLPVAVVYAFAFLAFAGWLRSRTWRNAVLTVACAAILPTLKTPGWLWLATLVPGVVAAHVSRKVLGALAGVAAALVFAIVAYASHVGPIAIFGYRIALQPVPIADSLISNFLLFANWNLLALIFPLALVLGRRALMVPAMMPLTMIAFGAVAAVVFVFFFTSASVEGVGAYTTINRAVLHLVPMLILYAAIVAEEAWRMRTADRSKPIVAAA